MADNIFNYCVATNTGKGFITHADSRNFWISGQVADVWVVTDTFDSRLWIARNNGVTKTKSEAQTIVTDIVNDAKNAWDDLSDDDKAASDGRPATITLP